MLAAAVGAQQGIGLPLRTKSLRIDGLEVITPGTAGNSFGVDPATVAVTEAGPGSVSSLSFTIDDPASQVTVREGQWVVFWDITRDLPIFAGWVDTFRVRAFGLGATISVTCVGVDAVLDWAWCPAWDYRPAAAVPWPESVVQGLAAISTGTGFPLRAASVTYGSLTFSTRSLPVCFNLPGVSYTGATYQGSSGTLRQVIEAYLQAFIADCNANTAPQVLFPGTTWVPFVTVDFYGGLRVSNRLPSDYATVTLDAAGASKPSDTEWSVATVGSPRSAVVTDGTNRTVVPDGTGIVGPTAVVSDSTLTTDALRRFAGQAYLNANRSSTNGTVAWDGAVLGTAGAEARAGGTLSLRDPQAGIPTATSYQIASISKTWAASGEERWVLSFGGLQDRTATGFIRSLTRTTLI